MDCAFSFYQNYPCRLTHTEMECDLPCEESLFSSQHPFAEPNFRFTRDLTVCEAFQKLFAEDQPISSSQSSSWSSVSSNAPNDMKLTVLDMFILIHRMHPSLVIVGPWY